MGAPIAAICAFRRPELALGSLGGARRLQRATCSRSRRRRLQANHLSPRPADSWHSISLSSSNIIIAIVSAHFAFSEAPVWRKGPPSLSFWWLGWPGWPDWPELGDHLAGQRSRKGALAVARPCQQQRCRPKNSIAVPDRARLSQTRSRRLQISSKGRQSGACQSRARLMIESRTKC